MKNIPIDSPKVNRVVIERGTYQLMLTFVSPDDLEHDYYATILDESMARLTNHDVDHLILSGVERCGGKILGSVQYDFWIEFWHLKVTIKPFHQAVCVLDLGPVSEFLR